MLKDTRYKIEPLINTIHMKFRGEIIYNGRKQIFGFLFLGELIDFIEAKNNVFESHGNALYLFCDGDCMSVHIENGVRVIVCKLCPNIHAII